MSSMAILGVVAAPLLALASTPVAIHVAGKLQLYDVPSDWKTHASPTPYTGGAAVTGAFLAALAITGVNGEGIFALGAATAVMWAVGTLDDYQGVHWAVRIGCEVAAGSILWAAGLGWSVLPSEPANLVLTAVWIVGIVNALNLLDLMDGVAGTVASVSAVGVGLLGLISGDDLVAIAAFCLAGACLGFLPYNMRRPARIFLGDGGSMPIGFVLGALLMAVGDNTDRGWVTILAAGVLLGLPLLDMAFRVASRHRRGVPLLQGGHDSLANYLQWTLRSPQAVVASLAGVQALLCLVGIAALELGERSVVGAWTIWFVVGTATVTLLERRVWAPVGPAQPSDATVTAVDSRPRQRSLLPLEMLLIAFIAISCGLSPFMYGFYDVSVWGPIALGMLAALLGLLIARPATPRPEALVAAVTLAALWLWALLSTGWAESADQAMTDANRWLLYAALFGVLVLLIRNERLSKIIVAAGTATIAAFGLYLLARMVMGSADQLFLEGRLHGPLGYVNGESGYLLVGVWPLVALAERSRRPWLAGLGAAGATVLLCLVVLGQSRAVVPAFVISTVVLMAAVPGRTRRAWALVVIACGVGVALSPVLEVYSTTRSATVDDSVVREAAVMIGIAAVFAGSLWALLVLGAGRLGSTPGGRPRKTLAWAPLVASAFVGVALSLSAVDDPIARVGDEYRAFVKLNPEVAGSTRFTSGAGNRYDYWRVAWDQFTDNPLRGVGAGNYDRTYFAERRSKEDIRQPHSIELQALGELGVVGCAALLLFLAAVLFGFVRRVRAARGNLEDRALAVAAGGAFLVWLIHTSVDWLHLIPGVTGLALASAAVLVGPWRRPAAEPAVGLRTALICSAAVVIVFGAAVVGRSALAEKYRADARDALFAQPQIAIAKADRSLALNDEALDTYYVKAAAYARLDDYRRARATLLEAADREPHDFVPWGLLGDLAVRRGDLRAARRAYRTAAGLNPQDEGLAAVARDPSAARDRIR